MLRNHGCQNLTEIGHSNETKPHLPHLGQNQHKIYASGSKCFVKLKKSNL